MCKCHYEYSFLFLIKIVVGGLVVFSHRSLDFIRFDQVSNKENVPKWNWKLDFVRDLVGENEIIAQQLIDITGTMTCHYVYAFLTSVIIWFSSRKRFQCNNIVPVSNLDESRIMRHSEDCNWELMVIRPKLWDAIDTLMKLAHQSIHHNLIKIVNRRKRQRNIRDLTHARVQELLSVWNGYLGKMERYCKSNTHTHT